MCLPDKWQRLAPAMQPKNWRGAGTRTRNAGNGQCDVLALAAHFTIPQKNNRTFLIFPPPDSRTSARALDGKVAAKVSGWGLPSPALVSPLKAHAVNRRFDKSSLRNPAGGEVTFMVLLGSFGHGR